MKFHLSNLFNGRKALAEQEEASGEMNILKAGLLEKPESAIAHYDTCPFTKRHREITIHTSCRCHHNRL